MKTEFPNPDDILNFVLTIDPDEGIYRSGHFTFDFAINQNFPHEPPKVQCREKIYHPNIDVEGKVCLNILREDWKPVLNLNAVIVGLQVSFFLALGVFALEGGEREFLLTMRYLVPVPRTQCGGPVEQGSCRRLAQ